MQSVDSAFTAEAQDTVRRVAQNLQVSWNAQYNPSNVPFTMGVSIVGGTDYLGSGGGLIGNPLNYTYTDESDYVMGMSWERQLNIPLGGLTKAMSDAELDNTSGRFLPDYMGGSSELFTSVLPKRPNIISAGFDIGGVDITMPQFTGLFTRSPQINMQNKKVTIESDDYMGYFENKLVSDTSMYTGVTTDTLMGTLLSQAGMSTSQYELDTGLNTIPFTIIEAGSKFSDVFNELAMAENGHFFQDEMGVFKFWNRQHFYSSPFNQVQSIISTSQVIDAESPNEDHIINVVEITSSIWRKRAAQSIFTLSGTVELIAGQNTEVFVNLDDPVLQVTAQTIAGYTNSDGTGSALSITVVSRQVFSQAIKYVLRSSVTGYLTQLDISGRSAVVGEELYTKSQDDSSVTAYQEKPLSINNKYIQNRTWANSYSQVILNRFSDPQSLIKITIRALPQLQNGDMVSWQGRYWRIYGIRTSLDPSAGFVQELLLLKPELVSYFTIGVSSIGGTDEIAA